MGVTFFLPMFRNATPSLAPFFVKKQVLSRNEIPHPMVSPVVNCGPYLVPLPEQLKQLPSSP